MRQNGARDFGEGARRCGWRRFDNRRFGNRRKIDNRFQIIGENDRERQIDGGGQRFVFCRDDDCLRFGYLADDGERAVFALAHPREAIERRRREDDDESLLRFVAPDFGGRQIALEQGDFVDADFRAAPGVARDFDNRVGDSARADIVQRENRIFRIVGAARDDFLRAPLHLGVVALHRIKIEIGVVFAAADGRRAAAAHSDSHARAAQMNDERARRERFFADIFWADFGEAARQHQRLGETDIAAVGARFENAEKSGQRGAPEFVVVGGGAERRVAHNPESGGETARARQRRGGGFRDAGQAERAHRKARKSDARNRADAGRRLVAQFAAGAGRRARKRRNGGRVIVGFGFGGEENFARRFAPNAIGGGEKPRAVFCRFQNRGVVVERDDDSGRIRGVGLADKIKKRRMRFAVAVAPNAAECFVQAVLRVGLRKHQQFGVGRIATGATGAIDATGAAEKNPRGARIRARKAGCGCRARIARGICMRRPRMRSRPKRRFATGAADENRKAESIRRGGAGRKTCSVILSWKDSPFGGGVSIHQPRSMRRTESRRQRRQISPAFEAQGETTPKRGKTSAPAVASKAGKESASRRDSMRRRSSLCGARAKATKKTSRPRAPRDPQKAKEATKRFYNARPRWKDFAFSAKVPFLRKPLSYESAFLTKAGIRKGLPAFAKAKGDSLPPHSAKPIWIPAFAGKGEWVAQKRRGRQSLGEGDNHSELGGNRPTPDGARGGGITTRVFPSTCSKRRL